jgi:hypothetical protein
MKLITNPPIPIDYLLVAGGGSGGTGAGTGPGAGGGGGAGGLLQGSSSVFPKSKLPIIIGSGGPLLNCCSTNGSNSTIGSSSCPGFLNTIAIGGGGGGYYLQVSPFTTQPGRCGGSGGGGLGVTSGGLGTINQGLSGGAGSSLYGAMGGGGGGACSSGTNSCAYFSGTYIFIHGCGGNGCYSTISGTTSAFAGGGGGGSGLYSYNDFTGYGFGGIGGGGNGNNGTGTSGAAGSPNTGGGGGGGGNCQCHYDSPGFSGGSGIAIIRYASSTLLASGGNTCTSYLSGGICYQSHIFTSSGNFQML